MVNANITHQLGYQHPLHLHQTQLNQQINGDLNGILPSYFASFHHHRFPQNQSHPPVLGQQPALSSPSSQPSFR